MKIIILFAFGFLLILFHCTVKTNQNYNYKKNYEVIHKIIIQQYLIESSTKNGFFLYLSACNLEPNCLTTVYQKNSMSMNTGTCILYSNIFQDSEITVSMASDLYFLYSKAGISSQTILSPELTTQSSFISVTESTAQSSIISTSLSVEFNITGFNIRLMTGKFSTVSK